MWVVKFTLHNSRKHHLHRLQCKCCPLELCGEIILVKWLNFSFSLSCPLLLMWGNIQRKFLCRKHKKTNSQTWGCLLSAQNKVLNISTRAVLLDTEKQNTETEKPSYTVEWFFINTKNKYYCKRMELLWYFKSHAQEVKLQSLFKIVFHLIVENLVWSIKGNEFYLSCFWYVLWSSFNPSN